jgi:hypothetical protein
MFKNLLILVHLLVGVSTACANDMDAYAVMKKVDSRYTGDNAKSDVVLALIDTKGRQRLRNLDMNRIEDSKATRTLIFFRSPSDVKGTAYMSFDWQNLQQQDDTWLFLPALQKITRLAASDESGSFMGSDFSYADINGLDLEDFEYEFVNGSETVDGHDCWVIKSQPKNARVIAETGYTGYTTWVRKDIFMPIKSIIQVKKGKKTKYYSARDIENIDGIWTAKTRQMVTTKNNKKQHSSVFKVNAIKYNTDIDENIFNTRAMQRGI